VLRSWTGGEDRARQAARPSRFTVRPIGRDDQPLALEALDRNPVRDVFIASRILHDGALTSLGPSFPAPREVRRRQFVYAVDPDRLVRDPHDRAPGMARLAERSDEDRVLKLSAAMYTEEMGENPMARDPDGYRRRVRMLISRGWTYVYEAAGQLQFKMDVGCASHHTAQIQGVYVPPELRGHGVGTAAMAACCDLALDRHPNLSLYVNDFNAPAVALYERIGFEREPYDFQTIMLP
jgi:uncharacterized protein